jgi:hypothetical protein
MFLHKVEDRLALTFNPYLANSIWENLWSTRDSNDTAYTAKLLHRPLCQSARYLAIKELTKQPTGLDCRTLRYLIYGNYLTTDHLDLLKNIPLASALCTELYYDYPDEHEFQAAMLHLYSPVMRLAAAYRIPNEMFTAQELAILVRDAYHPYPYRDSRISQNLAVVTKKILARRPDVVVELRASTIGRTDIYFTELAVVLEDVVRESAVVGTPVPRANIPFLQKLKSHRGAKKVPLSPTDQLPPELVPRPRRALTQTRLVTYEIEKIEKLLGESHNLWTAFFDMLTPGSYPLETAKTAVILARSNPRQQK